MRPLTACFLLSLACHDPFMPISAAALFTDLSEPKTPPEQGYTQKAQPTQADRRPVIHNESSELLKEDASEWALEYLIVKRNVTPALANAALQALTDAEKATLSRNELRLLSKTLTTIQSSTKHIKATLMASPDGEPLDSQQVRELSDVSARLLTTAVDTSFALMENRYSSVPWTIVVGRAVYNTIQRELQLAAAKHLKLAGDSESPAQ